MTLKQILKWIAYLLSQTFKDSAEGGNSGNITARAHARDLVAN